MPKYKVNVYYTTMGTAIVEAENEQKALEDARDMLTDEELLDSLQESEWDAEEVEDEE